MFVTVMFSVCDSIMEKEKMHRKEYLKICSSILYSCECVCALAKIKSSECVYEGRSGGMCFSSSPGENKKCKSTTSRLR